MTLSDGNKVNKEKRKIGFKTLALSKKIGCQGTINGLKLHVGVRIRENMEFMEINHAMKK